MSIVCLGLVGCLYPGTRRLPGLLDGYRTVVNSFVLRCTLLLLQVCQVRALQHAPRNPTRPHGSRRPHPKPSTKCDSALLHAAAATVGLSSSRPTTPAMRHSSTTWRQQALPLTSLASGTNPPSSPAVETSLLAAAVGSQQAAEAAQAAAAAHRQRSSCSGSGRAQQRRVAPIRTAAAAAAANDAAVHWHKSRCC
jgi:hypothetical protein